MKLALNAIADNLVEGIQCGIETIQKEISITTSWEKVDKFKELTSAIDKLVNGITKFNFKVTYDKINTEIRNGSVHFYRYVTLRKQGDNND